MNEKQIVESIDKILIELPERYREILIKRFGLRAGEKRHTLEAIGQDYGITRERIRQIENAAKKLILETDGLIVNTKKAVMELEKTVNELGGMASEKEILSKFTNDLDTQDYLHFVLQLSEPFYDIKKTDMRDRIWYTDKNSYEAFEESLDKLYKDLDTDELLTEKEIIDKFTYRLSQHTDNKKLLKIDTVKKLISLSKKIGVNGLGQWGRADSRNVTAKGVKDYAFLILNTEQKPMHFRKLTKEIAERFNLKVNVATVHNELIRDDRFILVGRGEYGLKEWKQYSGGTVKEVIVNILKKAKKALSKEEIIKEVLVKKNVRKQTIIINLSNKTFRRTKDGKYKLA